MLPVLVLYLLTDVVSITFDVEGTGETVEVFTTRPDTLMGVTYLVLAPEHPLTTKIAAPERREVRCFVSKRLVGVSVSVVFVCTIVAHRLSTKLKQNPFQKLDFLITVLYHTTQHRCWWWC